MSLSQPDPGETGTVGVIDMRVRHIAGEISSLCGRWANNQLYRIDSYSTRRAQLPLCKRCQEANDTACGDRYKGYTCTLPQHHDGTMHRDENSSAVWAKRRHS